MQTFTRFSLNPAKKAQICKKANLWKHGLPGTKLSEERTRMWLAQHYRLRIMVHDASNCKIVYSPCNHKVSSVVPVCFSFFCLQSCISSTELKQTCAPIQFVCGQRAEMAPPSTATAGGPYRHCSPHSLGNFSPCPAASLRGLLPVRVAIARVATL